MEAHARNPVHLSWPQLYQRPSSLQSCAWTPKGELPRDTPWAPAVRQRCNTMAGAVQTRVLGDFDQPRQSYDTVTVKRKSSLPSGVMMVGDWAELAYDNLCY